MVEGWGLGEVVGMVGEVVFVVGLGAAGEEGGLKGILNSIPSPDTSKPHSSTSIHLPRL